MATVEPIPGEPAAVATVDGERALVIADFHAGIEAALRYEQGVEIESAADERQEQILSLLDESGATHVVFLGDLAHAIGGPEGAERDEIDALLDAITARASVTIVKGNHDGDIETVAGPAVEVTDGSGIRIGDVGFAHGHTWPSQSVLSADIVCVAHEHPTVRLEDTVGGSRVERVWLRGDLAADPFEEYYDCEFDWPESELVVFPAFNDLTGGTWVNVEGQEFLSPFLPDALSDGEAYLLDGTRLGAYDRV